MKYFLIIISCLLLTVNYSKSSVYDDGLLDGRIFYGKAEEVLPPYIDRMPRVRNEVIIFRQGKVTSEMLKSAKVNEAAYSAEVDGRRAIAIEVILFNSESTSIVEGKEVEINFSGEVFAGNYLTGTLKIKYSENYSEEYTITADNK